MKPSKLSKFRIYLEYDKNISVIRRETKKRASHV